MTPNRRILQGIALCSCVVGSATAMANGILKPTEIKLKTAISAPCISVESDDVRIVLPKAKIDIYAAAKQDSHWKTEKERWTFIRGDQARDIESKMSKQRNGDCFSVALADLDKTQTRDGEYLIWDFLEKGEAMVIANGSEKPEANIIMKSMSRDDGAGADMWFLLKGQTKPFLKLTWWIV
jgi:hypothetical protein